MVSGFWFPVSGFWFLEKIRLMGASRAARPPLPEAVTWFV